MVFLAFAFPNEITKPCHLHLQLMSVLFSLIIDLISQSIATMNNKAGIRHPKMSYSQFHKKKLVFDKLPIVHWMHLLDQLFEIVYHSALGFSINCFFIKAMEFIISCLCHYGHSPVMFLNIKTYSLQLLWNPHVLSNAVLILFTKNLPWYKEKCNTSPVVTVYEISFLVVWWCYTMLLVLCCSFISCTKMDTE